MEKEMSLGGNHGHLPQNVAALRAVTFKLSRFTEDLLKCLRSKRFFDDICGFITNSLMACHCLEGILLHGREEALASTSLCHDDDNCGGGGAKTTKANLMTSVPSEQQGIRASKPFVTRGFQWGTTEPKNHN